LFKSTLYIFKMFFLYVRGQFQKSITGFPWRYLVTSFLTASFYFLTMKIPLNSLLRPSEEDCWKDLKKLDSAFTRGSQGKLKCNSLQHQVVKNIQNRHNIRIYCTISSSLILTAGFLIFVLYFIQHCFNCRPLNYTVSEDAGLEPRTVAALALAVRRSNISARSDPLSARYHPRSRLDLSTLIFKILKN